MKQRKPLIALVAIAALAAAGPAYASGSHASAASTVVSTKHTSLGTILVTGSGRTLYADRGDTPRHFACTGGCLTIWPPLKATGAVKASGAANKANLGKTKGPGGEMVTYKGHPLYTFASDSKSNPTSGEGQNGFYVVGASGSMITNPSKPTTSTPSPTPPTTTTSPSSQYHY
jgi:predicted lipoprotein with Yx(FWY)xxD motif